VILRWATRSVKLQEFTSLPKKNKALKADIHVESLKELKGLFETRCMPYYY